MDQDITVRDKKFRVLIPEDEIKEMVKSIASEINEHFRGKDPVLVPILNGAFIFAADLCRELTIPHEVQFAKVSSYGDAMSSSGKVNIELEVKTEIKGRHVIVVEDILDSGLTIDSFKEHLNKFEPASITVVVLLFKPEIHQGKEKPDLVGKEIPNDFVVGYGLDYAQQGRNLKGIYHVVE